MVVGIEEIDAHLVNRENRILLDILLLRVPVGLDAHVVVHDLGVDVGVKSDLTELEVRRHLVRAELRCIRHTDEEIILANT